MPLRTSVCCITVLPYPLFYSRGAYTAISPPPGKYSFQQQKPASGFYFGCLELPYLLYLNFGSIKYQMLMPEYDGRCEHVPIYLIVRELRCSTFGH